MSCSFSKELDADKVVLALFMRKEITLKMLMSTCGIIVAQSNVDLRTAGTWLLDGYNAYKGLFK